MVKTSGSCLAGEYVVEIGDQRFRLGPGDSVLGPRRVPHAFVYDGAGPGRILIGFTPAGRIEQFFRDRKRGEYFGNGSPEDKELPASRSAGSGALQVHGQGRTQFDDGRVASVQIMRSTAVSRISLSPGATCRISADTPADVSGPRPIQSPRASCRARHQRTIRSRIRRVKDTSGAEYAEVVGGLWKTPLECLAASYDDSKSTILSWASRLSHRQECSSE